MKEQRNHLKFWKGILIATPISIFLWILIICVFFAVFSFSWTSCANADPGYGGTNGQHHGHSIGAGHNNHGHGAHGWGGHGHHHDGDTGDQDTDDSDDGDQGPNDGDVGDGGNGGGDGTGGNSGNQAEESSSNPSGEAVCQPIQNCWHFRGSPDFISTILDN